MVLGRTRRVAVRCLLGLTGCVALLAPAPARADVVTVKPETACGIFTYLAQSGCEAESVEVGQQAFHDPRFWELLMGFDLAEKLPPGAVVESATFNLRQDGSLDTEGDLSVWGLSGVVDATFAASVAGDGTFNSEIVEDWRP